MKLLDPNGVERRSQHKLKRSGAYSTKRPSFIVHLDDYDKLKPFGLYIHGAIDGRRIVLLEVGPSNNNTPCIVARYFLDCVKQLGGVPRTIRGDRGTENVNIATMQSFLRRNKRKVFICYSHLDAR